MPWAALAVAAALAFGGWHWWHPGPVQSGGPLILQTADIDQAATASAREMLARGEVPLTLATADEETRRAVAEGRESLYTKKLLPPDAPADVMIHVTVTEGGMVLGEDVLDSAHPNGTTFPARTGDPVHFHFAVESAGPKGSVTCWVQSLGGQTVYTLPMSTGGHGDLEAVAQ